MPDITLTTTDTRKIAARIEFAIRTTKAATHWTKQQKIDGRVMFIKRILDEFRHLIIFQKPSVN